MHNPGKVLSLVSSCCHLASGFRFPAIAVPPLKFIDNPHRFRLTNYGNIDSWFGKTKPPGELIFQPLGGFFMPAGCLKSQKTRYVSCVNDLIQISKIAHF
jgi:hypothetical protein